MVNRWLMPKSRCGLNYRYVAKSDREPAQSSREVSGELPVCAIQPIQAASGRRRPRRALLMGGHDFFVPFVKWITPA
jgi:hypothetical protein